MGVGVGQVVHIKNVLPEATDVLARVGTETGYQTRGDAVSVLGHGRQNSSHVSDVDSMIVLATSLAYLSCFSCSTGSPLLTTGTPKEPSRGVVKGFYLCGFGADVTADLHAGDEA
jgi:hypothetical protein